MTRPETAIAEPASRRAAVRGPRLVSSVERSKSATPTPRLATVSTTSARRPATATTRTAVDPERLTDAGELAWSARAEVPVAGSHTDPDATVPGRTLGVERASGPA